MCPCGCVQRHNGGEGPACNLPRFAGRKQDSHHSHSKSQIPANSEEVCLPQGTSLLTLVLRVTPRRVKKRVAYVYLRLQGESGFWLLPKYSR